MTARQHYRIRIDQLPEEVVEACSPADAARQVAAMLAAHEALRRLADEESVEIKHPDGTPWGRNLTVGAFRSGEVDFDAGTEGPMHSSSISRL